MQFKVRSYLLLLFSVLATVVALSAAYAQQEMSPVTSTSTVHHFADASEIDEAWSTLTRTNYGVIATLHTADLIPNDVVTMWWVIFNEPANCTDACSEDDIFLVGEDGEMVIGDNGPELNVEQVEAAQIAVLGATGNVISDSGEGHFSAVLSTGDNPNVVFGPALLDPMKAEIHLVLRTHGTLNPDALDEQIIAFNGGCAADWPNEPCQDVQFAVHQPQ